VLERWSQTPLSLIMAYCWKRCSVLSWTPPCHGLSRFARTEPHMVAMMDVQIPLCRSGHPTEQLHQCTRCTHLYVVEEVVQHNQNGSLYPDYDHDAAANCLVAVDSALAHGLTTEQPSLAIPRGESPEPEGRGFTRRIRFIDDRSRNDDIRSCLRMSQVRGLYWRKEVPVCWYF